MARLGKAPSSSGGRRDAVEVYVRSRRGGGPGGARRPAGAPTRLPAESFRLDLDLAPFRALVWATGFRPRYPWLHPSFLDRRGRLAHDGGVLPTPGAYVLGLPFLRRRKSSFLDGVGPDAEELTEHLIAHLDRTARPVRVGTSASGP